MSCKVAFDVDGTLIEALSNPIPRYHVIDILLWFVRNGDEVYVWSGGGVEYADHLARKLGLRAMIHGVIAKGSEEMDVCFDDEEVTLAKVNIKV